MRYSPMLLVICLIAAEALAADIPAIRELSGITPHLGVFDVSSATKPVVVKSEKKAGGYFAKDELARLTKEVDFSKQLVLVFAWHGSGGDRLKFTVAESAPEQVTFTLVRGMSADLRPHVYVYSLRNDVTWSVK